MYLIMCGALPYLHPHNRIPMLFNDLDSAEEFMDAMNQDSEDPNPIYVMQCHICPSMGIEGK